MTIKQTIEKLDEMRGKATQGEWKVFNEYDCWAVVKVGDNEKEPIFDDGSSAGEYSPRCSEIDRDYIIALHNSYETIRNAALAGEALAEAVESMEVTAIACSKDPAAQYALNFLLDQLRRRLKEISVAYHSAIEEK